MFIRYRNNAFMHAVEIVNDNMRSFTHRRLHRHFFEAEKMGWENDCIDLRNILSMGDGFIELCLPVQW